MEQPSIDKLTELYNKLFSANDFKWKAAEYKPWNTIDYHLILQ